MPGIGIGICLGIASGPPLPTAPPNAPTIGTAAASYNDIQGNIYTVTFAPSGSGQPAANYLVTLSTGETKSGASSPIVFINTLSNDVARTATVQAVNAAGQSASSSASNSATPISLVRTAVVQNRVYYQEETQAKIATVDLRAVITGSGDLKDFAPMVHGWYESYLTSYTAISGAYTINEMSAYSGANTPVPVTWGGFPSITINPGDTEIIADYITAAQLLGVGNTVIPRGTKIWYKFRITFASTSQGALCTADLMADMAGSQHAFYDPVATTLTNTSLTQGAWTATGTALVNARPTGMVPQTVGHYAYGDPATYMGIGDSIIAASNHDEISKETGRGWFQNLMTDDGAVTNPVSSMNCGVANDFNTKFATNPKMLALSKFNRYGICAAGVNDIAQQGTGNVSVIHTAEKVIWSTMKSSSRGGAMRIIRKYLTPRSETAGPPKTLNSAPNTQWGLGEKSQQMHALYAADLTGGFIDYFIQDLGVRQSEDPNDPLFYLWKYNGGTNVYDTIMTTDGLHVKNVAVRLIANSFRPLLAQLA